MKQMTMDNLPVLHAFGWTAGLAGLILLIGVGAIIETDTMSFRDWIASLLLCAFLFLALSGVLS